MTIELTDKEVLLRAEAVKLWEESDGIVRKVMWYWDKILPEQRDKLLDKAEELWQKGDELWGTQYIKVVG